MAGGADLLVALDLVNDIWANDLGQHETDDFTGQLVPTASTSALLATTEAPPPTTGTPKVDRAPDSAK